MTQSKIAELSDLELLKEYAKVTDWWLTVRSIGEALDADALMDLLFKEIKRRELQPLKSW